ncbi:MAG: DUF3015 domain-containing protein [Leptospiraceae bacterium]|nr:DUF3015 domain-containing protein [Leptospiraceae bacterium]MCP5510972.1 DUF3015 domain-containing protein [Leptospiraceae bacterium]
MKINKSLLITITSLSLFFISPISAGGYGMAGCGLGSLIIKPNNFLQIFAATTNGTYANQTFGITSGTSNCASSGIVKNEKAGEIFVHMNYESLEKEMAMGKGEKLDTLATLFGCKNSSSFASMTKNKYEKLFSEEDPSNLFLSLKTEIKNDKTLSTTCSVN